MCEDKLEKTDKALVMYLKIRCVRVKIYGLENKNITYLEGMFVALFVHHAVRMCILSSGSCQAQQNS
jgi:hypothetical protein